MKSNIGLEELTNSYVDKLSKHKGFKLIKKGKTELSGYPAYYIEFEDISNESKNTMNTIMWFTITPKYTIFINFISNGKDIDQSTHDLLINMIETFKLSS
jgi:hypothetical protein